MKIIRNFLMSLKMNIRSIITAVIAATVIWLAISLQIFPDVSATVSDVPVQITPTAFMLENDLHLVQNGGITVNVQVRGKRYDVERLSGEDFEAVLDLSGVNTDGEQEVGIDIFSNSRIDFDISVPYQTIKIKVERVASKTLEIEAKATTIRFVEGMQIDEANLSVNPPTITIRGEKSLIDSISRAEVHALYEDEMITTLAVNGELRLFNNENVQVNNPNLSTDADSFTVTVPIHRVKTLPLDFVITGVPSNFDLEGLRAKMNLSPNEITLSSPDFSIDNLAAFEVGAIPLAEINTLMLFRQTRYTIAPLLPEGYKNTSGQASVMLEFEGVEDYAQYEFHIPAENIVVLNPPDGYRTEILTKNLVVTVVGPSSYVQAMSVNNIGVTLNLIGTEILSDVSTVSKTVQCRLTGSRVPAWVVGYPQIDVRFTRTD